MKKFPQDSGLDQASGELMLSHGDRKTSGRVRESGGLKARLIDDQRGQDAVSCGRQVTLCYYARRNQFDAEDCVLQNGRQTQANNTGCEERSPKLNGSSSEWLVLNVLWFWRRSDG